MALLSATAYALDAGITQASARVLRAMYNERLSFATRPPREDGVEDVKVIGVYSTRENAAAAISRLSRIGGFRDAASGFHVDEYQLDQDQWVEGYTTIANA